MKTCPQCYNEYEDSLNTCPTDSAELSVIETDPLIGTRLADRYQIVSVIGHGGMGVVYKARHENMDRFMAVKMLHSHMVSEPESVKRFYREAKTVSQVKHHHIITLYDFGMSPKGQPYLVMDFLEGTSLKNTIKQIGPLPLERVEHIFKQVMDALSSAHAQNVVHRDLKPENIVLSKHGNKDDWVTLVDFGLSKLNDSKSEDINRITKVGDVCGSPPYMSPEQCLSSQVVDPRSDIYSLAICMYESITGKLPFAAKSAIEMLDCHLYATPMPLSQVNPNLKVCSELTNLFCKALQKDPEKRHQDITEFSLQFNEALSRDALKLKAYKYRTEVAAFQGLITEAQSAHQISHPKVQLEEPNLMFDVTSADLSKVLESSKESKAAKVLIDGEWFMQFSPPAPQVDNKETEPALVKETGRNCPSCKTPIESSVKLCTNCEADELISAEEIAKLIAIQRTHSRTKIRGKTSTYTRILVDPPKKRISNVLVNMRKLILPGLLIISIYGAYIVSQNNKTKLNSLIKIGIPKKDRLKR